MDSRKAWRREAKDGMSMPWCRPRDRGGTRVSGSDALLFMERVGSDMSLRVMPREMLAKRTISSTKTT